MQVMFLFFFGIFRDNFNSLCLMARPSPWGLLNTGKVRMFNVEERRMSHIKQSLELQDPLRPFLPLSYFLPFPLLHLAFVFEKPAQGFQALHFKSN